MASTVISGVDKSLLQVDSDPVPVTTVNLCRYVAYLGRSYRFCTVQQYINIVRLIHLEMGLSNPLKDNWSVSSVLAGVQQKRVLLSHTSFQ